MFITEVSHQNKHKKTIKNLKKIEYRNNTM